MPQEYRDPEVPLPRGWLNELSSLGDFDRSFKALAGREHFYAEAMRGLIRSMQLRFKEAWKHFDQACEASLFAEESVGNLVRRFHLNVYTIYNALLESPVDKSRRDLPALWTPDIPRAVLDEYPEVRLVLFVRKLSEATLRLHVDESETAGEIFAELLEEWDEAIEPEYAAIPHIGLAASEFNLGNEDQALITLEVATAVVRDGRGVLARARDAAAMHALHYHTGQMESAAFWKHFIESLPCPRATRDAFLRRANIIRRRCQRYSRALFM